jgi:hypothetical protein
MKLGRHYRTCFLPTRKGQAWIRKYHQLGASVLTSLGLGLHLQLAFESKMYAQEKVIYPPPGERFLHLPCR